MTEGWDTPFLHAADRTFTALGLMAQARRLMRMDYWFILIMAAVIAFLGIWHLKILKALWQTDGNAALWAFVGLSAIGVVAWQLVKIHRMMRRGEEEMKFLALGALNVIAEARKKVNPENVDYLDILAGEVARYLPKKLARRLLADMKGGT